MVSGRKALVILGMHRSGTSALTGMLGKLGCILPRDLLGPGIGNSEGHWESEGLICLNDKLLDSGGSRWDDWLRFNPQWYASPLSRQFLTAARTALSDTFGPANLIVYKDPRLCRLLPFWRMVFDAEAITPAIVFTARNPLEVASSLESRDAMEQGYALLLWLRHVIDAEAGSRDLPRTFVTYDQLLDDWYAVAGKVAREHDIVWPRDTAAVRAEISAFLSDRHRHNFVADDRLASMPDVAEWIRRAYAVFARWARSGEDAADYAELDVIAREFDASGAVFGPILRAGNHSLLAGEGERYRMVLSEELEVSRGQVVQLEEALARESQAASGLEDRIAQQLREMEALRSALAEREAEVAVRSGEIEGLRKSLGEGAASLAAQAAELLRIREAHGAQIEDLLAQLHTLRSIVRQREEEITQSLAGQDRLQEQVADVEGRLAEAKGQLVEERAWVFRLAGERREAESEIARLSRQVDAWRPEEARLRAKVDNLEREKECLAVAARDDKAALADLAVRNAREAEARSSNEVEIAERFGELAAMTGMLREEEEAHRRESETRAWLQQVHKVIHRQPWWALALPRSLRQRRDRRRLLERGLFDAQAYLSRYPDVALSGADPLLHYITHGLAENRSRF